MTQGERLISGFQHYYKKHYHVSTRRLSLCGPSHVCVIITFLREDCVCVIKFILESSGFCQKIIFKIRRAHSRIYRGVTIRRAHFRKSIGMKCMWSIIFSLNTRTKHSSKMRAPKVTSYHDTTTYHEGYTIFRWIEHIRQSSVHRLNK